MKLREALEWTQNHKPAGGEQVRYQLACSSTPRILETFLSAFLIQQSPETNILIDTQPYGDLLGGLENLNPARYTAISIICEWFDLDPRLGFRRLGGWAPAIQEDLMATVSAGFERLRGSVERLAEAAPVAVALPSLPTAPVEISAPWQALNIEARLSAQAWSLGEWCISQPNVRLVSPAELDRISPPSERFDLRTEIAQGAPYRVSHASALAELLSRLMAPPSPLKGLITDLDDTLWRGILGDVGISGIAFTLDSKAQIHGLYQQFLQSLAERGVLLGVASKNDSALANDALSRADLLVKRESFFPVIANWGPKSESVARILEAWNIGPEAAVFVDDSALDAAEVQTRFAQIRTVAFPTHDPHRILELFRTLREWFGKPVIRAEDRLRASSLRSAAEAGPLPTDPASRESFLAALRGKISLRVSRDASDQRAFELVNKTNQFNLNGRRVTEAGWRQLLANPDAFLLTAAYEDKFGALGKVAVAAGESRRGAATISCWVMSCRAFSRRIEFAILRRMFETLNVEKVMLEFEKTSRNTPLQEFLASLQIPESAAEISRADFEARCPPLHHNVETHSHAGS